MSTNFTDTQMQNYQYQTVPMQRPVQTVPIQRPMQQIYPGMLQQPQTGATARPAPVYPQPSIVPSTLENPFYLAGILRKFLGQNMRVSFLIGTNAPLVDRTGTLIEVGANYIILQPQDSDDLVVCDLYSIKFVDIIR